MNYHFRGSTDRQTDCDFDIYFNKRKENPVFLILMIDVSIECVIIQLLKPYIKKKDNNNINIIFFIIKN